MTLKGSSGTFEILIQRMRVGVVEAAAQSMPLVFLDGERNAVVVRDCPAIQGIHAARHAGLARLPEESPKPKPFKLGFKINSS